MWRIEGLLEMLNGKFHELRLVPVRNCQVVVVYTHEVELVRKMQGLFRTRGWPDELDRFDIKIRAQPV